MAIVVEWVRNNLGSLTSISPEWAERVRASQRYGFPIEIGIPTYPPEQDWRSDGRKRSYLDGYQLYTLPGLLGAIFSYLELEDDYRAGIRQFSDIARSSIKLLSNSSAATLEQKDAIEIGQNAVDGKSRFILNDGSQKDITSRLLAMSEYAFGTRRYKSRQIFSQSVKGTLQLHPIESTSNQNPFADIYIRAFNLPGLGDDMDEVMTLERHT